MASVRKLVLGSREVTVEDFILFAALLRFGQ